MKRTAWTRAGAWKRDAGAHSRTSIWVDASRWLPSLDRDVFTTVTRAGTWSEWLGVARASDDVALTKPGQVAGGALVLGRREIDVDWRVISRVRDIVTLAAVREETTIATLVISVSAWNGGAMVELRLDAPRASRWMLRRRLERSLDALERMTSTAAPAPAADGAAWLEPAGLVHGPRLA